MTDTTTHSEDILKKVSRRKLLKNSAIAATGVVLLPPFITSCNKEDNLTVPTPGSGVGGELTQVDLAQAAANLTTLRQLIKEVYDLSAQYDEAVFHALASTKENANWTNFIVDLFIDIGLAIASEVFIAAATPAAKPAIALFAAILKDWGIGKDRPSNLDGVFAEYQFGHNKMQYELQQKLSSLVDPGNNYSNLTAAWKDPIRFNDDTYSLGDLANTKFELGDEYNKLHAAAFTCLKKAVWNLAIMKCCAYHQNWGFLIELPSRPAASYARSAFYPLYKGAYLRGYQNGANGCWMVSWNLGINGKPFSDEASNQLFKDDIPGNIINPEGLFNRSYVFRQFSTQKPDFRNGVLKTQTHELGDPNSYDAQREFNLEEDNYIFTGGLFQRLTH